MRRWLPPLLVLAVLAAVVVGLTQTRGGPSGAATAPYDLQAGLRRLEGSPPPLAALHRQAAEVLPGGTTALRARLRALHGHPVVVNVWASWCGPCKAEFPYLQRVATSRGRTVAFLGVDTKDHRGPAADFLHETPVPYPSFVDTGGQPLVRALGQPANLVPVTVFIARDGSTAFAKAGGYGSRVALERDIDRYLHP